MQEICDGGDDDCDGVPDDDCQALDPATYLVGTMRLERTGCEPGEQLAISVLVADPEGQAISYEWAADEGLSVAPLTGSSEVRSTCPDPGPQQASCGLYLTATDEDGNALWAFDELTAHPAGSLHGAAQAEEAAGCSSLPAVHGFWLAWLAALCGVVRRRRRYCRVQVGRVGWSGTYDPQLPSQGSPQAAPPPSWRWTSSTRS